MAGVRYTHTGEIIMWLRTGCNLEFQMGGLTPLILMLLIAGITSYIA